MCNKQSITAYILENMMTAVIFLDSELTIKYINPATEQLFSLSSRKFLNKPLFGVFDYSNFDFERLETLKNKNIGLGYTDHEVTFVTEGISLLAEVTVTPIDEKDERLLLLELRKIDQQRKINQEVQQHAQQIAARDLIRGLAHEIKNPLGGLRGAAQLLERQFKGQQDVKDYTSVIIEQADRLKNLVDKLLGPQRATQRTINNIHEVLEKVRKLVCMDLPSNIKIRRDYDPSIPELEMDPDQLQQAILNIVCNAILILKEKNVVNGLITLKTRAVYRISIHGNVAKTAILIQIIDNGPGVPQNIRDTIFYPMVTGRSGGTSLGLSISQNIVDQHCGKIECSSTSGYTEFSIFLPLKE